MPHGAVPCGHQLCLKCFVGSGINVTNTAPYPPCPLCRKGVQMLLRLFMNNAVPRSELVPSTEGNVIPSAEEIAARTQRLLEEQVREREEEDAALARQLNADLNNQGAGGPAAVAGNPLGAWNPIIDISGELWPSFCYLYLV